MRARHLAAGVLLFGLGYCTGDTRQLTRDRPGDAAAGEGTVVVPEAAVASLPEGLSPEERRDIEVFRRASPSVVHITNYGLARDFWTFDVFEIPQGTGSGIVWDRQGRIVTNYHVIEGGRRFLVRLADQSEYEAELVGSAPEKDLAVLKVEAPASKLVPLTPGRSERLVVGQRVLAIGNPFGLDHSLTVGVVSALGREITSPTGRRIRDVVQTDAAINPGNSGGPLLDSTGRLIGVNAAIKSPTGASAGIGFAIPVDTVSRIVPQLIAHGRPVQPGIGVVFHPQVTTLAARRGLQGLPIYVVREGSPAEGAGLRGVRITRSGRLADWGDLIVEVNGKRIGSVEDLQDAFEAAGVGAEVSLTVLREGKRRQVRVRLAPIEQD